jgi:predicted NBD/HSP70 family sugar kinase
LLEEAEFGPSTGGRAPRILRFRADSGFVLAADLGATHTSVAAADLSGRLLVHHEEPSDIAAGPEAVLGHVQELFDQILGAGERLPGRLWGIGIGVPGPVEFGSGRPVAPPIMPGWDGYPVRDVLAERYDVPVWVDNDVNVMALGEFWRSWHDDVQDLLYVKVGTGIGAGLIAGGAVFRGARGAAGDIGHVRVDSPKRVVCDCGNEDCLEAVAAGRALARDLRDAGFDTADTRDVVELVAAGNPDAVRAVRAAGRRLGEALAAAVNLLNPELIVVGGDLVEVHDQLLAGVREVVYQRSTALATQSLRIEESQLGQDAGIEGCIVLALEELLSTDVIDDLIEHGRSAGATA